MKIKILSHEMELTAKDLAVLNEIANHNKINLEDVIYLGMSVLYTSMKVDPESNRVITGIKGISIPLKLNKSGDCNG